tara:strand:+ start:538 stop:828 length:291 start_codon:yes stop_codon:yes gene_type:complete
MYSQSRGAYHQSTIQSINQIIFYSTAQASQQADIGDFRQQVERYEFGLLQTALAQHQHHQSHTAHALGLSYHQLRGLLKKHKLAKSQGHEQGHEHD